MKVKVYAKLNLTLNVFPKVGNFHPLDSVVTSVNIFDVVEVTPRKDKKVKIKGFLPTAENIAYKTAVAFVKTLDWAVSVRRIATVRIWGQPLNV